MYYELYIDVFFLENFMLDSLLLLVVNRVMNNGRSYSRILLGGAAGSFLTCLVVAVPLPSAVRMLVFCILVSSVMVYTGLQIMRLSQFVQAFLLLYAAAFLTGGVMQLFRPYNALRECVLCSGCRKLCAHSEIVESTFAYVQTAKCDPQGDSVYRQGGKAAESSP